ncbi:MAG: hypothetical protein AB1593_04770 [Pseudomonadota bacterium]
MKCVTKDALFGYLDLLGKTQRQLSGFIGEGGCDFHHGADFGGREAAEDGVETDGKVRLNVHDCSLWWSAGLPVASIGSPENRRKMNGHPADSGTQNIFRPPCLVPIHGIEQPAVMRLRWRHWGKFGKRTKKSRLIE